MVVNTESVVGYNNKLKKATTFMRIGVNSDLNIPVRRSTQKHNLGSRAVKLPHSGVETQNSVAGATADAETQSSSQPGKPEKAKLRTKETQVVKSEKSEKIEKTKKRSQGCFDFAREQFECFDYCRRCFSLVSFQMK